MRADPIGRRFGYGASHFRVAAEALAPVEPVSPFAGAGSAAATVVVSGVIVFAGLRALNDDDVDTSALRIVPMQAAVVEPEPLPEPEPIPEPEPEPVVVAKPEPPPPPPPKPKPEPVVVAKAEPPKPKPVVPKPEPMRAPAPKLEPPPPPPKPEPVAKPARRAPMPMIDAPRAPQPTETEKQTAWRPPAVKTPKMPSAPALPRVAIDGVAGTPDPAPQKPSRVSSLAPGVAGPKRAAAPAIPRVAPPSAVAPALPGEAVTDLPSRVEPSAPKQERAARPTPARPVAFAGAASASATHTPMESASAMRERVAAAPLPSAAPRAEPDEKLRGVPLSAFPACRTDQREDTLKLAVLAAVGKKRDCSSAAGTFRFVETKNLNSFLLWIERAPGRAAADRCGELTHALNCLSRPGAK